MRLAWIGLVLAGCLTAPEHHCADGRVCPADATCDEDHGRCTTPVEVEACDGLVDGDVCNIGPLDPGHCDRGVCLRCGDGILNAGEVCDDGNRADRDGCSADCQSDETCGNGTIDRVAGETCDDGNRLDHDGCSSTCQTEAPRWISRPAKPPGRVNAGLAYDASRDRIVMTAGLANNVFFTDTWELNGVWELPPPAPLLPVLIQPAATYDTFRHRTLLFGGINVIEGVPSGGTFEWDGLTWQPGPDGPPRFGHAMVYDSHRNKAVAFGGIRDITQQTVELDSATSTWSVRATATTPPSRGGFALAYDPKRSVVVMFGGSTGPTVLGDIWEYDGTDWRAVTPTGQAPSPRSRSAMAFDTTLQELVLFGGATNEQPATTFANDTWSWNGTRWAPITTTVAPPASGGHVLVATTTNIYLFGGSTADTGSPAFQQTWRFDRTTWTAIIAPSSRNSAAAVTDTRHGRMLLVGGTTASVGDETWAIGRSGPQLLAHSIDVSEPGTATDTALGYDPDRDQLVLFSGLIPGDNTRTWTFTGTKWLTASPTVIPPPRTDAGFAWDPVGHTLLLFGGADLTSGEGLPLNDTWRWTGADWAEVQIDDPQRPPARTRMAMATDPVRRQIVMVGGTSVFGPLDSLTWIWNGTGWEARDVTPQPPMSGALFPELAWNPARQRLVLLLTPVVGLVQSWEWDGAQWEQIVTVDPPISGTTGPWAATSIDGNGVTLSVAGNDGDTAELRWDTAPHDELCDGGDLDGDMLTRCADPDCWWACSPLCPPGTTCDASAPVCGDGRCDPTESCRTCPGDCGACATVCGDFVCDANETCPGDCP